MLFQIIPSSNLMYFWYPIKDLIRLNFQCIKLNSETIKSCSIKIYFSVCRSVQSEAKLFACNPKLPEFRKQVHFKSKV